MYCPGKKGEAAQARKNDFGGDVGIDRKLRVNARSHLRSGERKEEMEAISRRGRARQKKGGRKDFSSSSLLVSYVLYSRETQDRHESPKKKGTFLLSEALAGKKEYRVRKPNLYLRAAK